MNFSSRTNWHRGNNRISAALDERRLKGLPVHDLTCSNPTECGFTYPENDILRAISNPSLLHYEPDPKGLQQAREAIAEHYAAKNVTLDLRNIIVTTSSSEAYSHIFRLLCNSDDALLAPAPSYPLFEYLAQIHDVRVLPYPLDYDRGWNVDPDAIARMITPTTRAIILVSPHNPTGMFLKQDEFSRIAALARMNNLALVVDEVFSEYAIGDTANRITTAALNAECLTLTLNGISKMCGLPQMKLSWIVVSGEGGVVSEAVGRLEILSDTFLSVNTPVQSGLRELLTAGASVRRQIVARCAQNRAYLVSRVRSGSACALLESEGGWSAILRIPATKPEEDRVLEILERTGVYVFPGYFFDFAADGYLVVSLLGEPGKFQTSIDSLIEVVDNPTTL